jgi:hypothetical protein
LTNTLFIAIPIAIKIAITKPKPPTGILDGKSANTRFYPTGLSKDYDCYARYWPQQKITILLL